MRSIQTTAMLHFSLKYSKNLALARLDLELLVLMKKCVIIDQCLWLFYSDLWQNFIDCPFQGHKQTKMKIQKKKEMAKWYMNTTTSKYIAPPIRVWSQSHRWAIQKHKSMKYQHNVNTSISPLKCQQPPFLFLHSLLVNEQMNKRRTKYMFYNNQKHQLQTNTEFWWHVTIEWN